MSVPVYFMPKPRDSRGCECFAFRWIGQSLAYCDGCGHPFWVHTHMEVGGQRLFYSRRYVIQADEREAVRRKWSVVSDDAVSPHP